jgi:hypothetical protein
MRGRTLVVAGIIGLACCMVSLIGARGPGDAESVHAPQGMPHLMRGWTRTPPKALWWPAEQ